MKKLNVDEQCATFGGEKKSGRCKKCGRYESWYNVPEWMIKLFHKMDYGHSFQ